MTQKPRSKPARPRWRREKAELSARLIEIEASLESHEAKDWEEQATEREGDEVLEGMVSGAARTAHDRRRIGACGPGDYGALRQMRGRYCRSASDVLLTAVLPVLRTLSSGAKLIFQEEIMAYENSGVASLTVLLQEMQALDGHPARGDCAGKLMVQPGRPAHEGSGDDEAAIEAGFDNMPVRWV